MYPLYAREEKTLDRVLTEIGKKNRLPATLQRTASEQASKQRPASCPRSAVHSGLFRDGGTKKRLACYTFRRSAPVGASGFLLPGPPCKAPMKQVPIHGLRQTHSPLFFFSEPLTPLSLPAMSATAVGGGLSPTSGGCSNIFFTQTPCVHSS